MRVRGSRFPHNRFFPVLLLVVLLGSGGTLQATQVRPLTLEQLSQRAATIFSGRCTGVRVESDPNVGWVTLATFEVERAVKGRVGRTATLRLLGGRSDLEPRAAEVPGMPRFRRGDEVVLFLYGTSAIGLTSPVGLGQGKFDVVRDKRGRKIAVNAFGNERLLERLPPAARGRIDAEAASAHRGGGIDVRALLDAAALLGK